MKYRYFKHYRDDEVSIMFLYIADSYLINGKSVIYISSTYDIMITTNLTEVGYEI